MLKSLSIYSRRRYIRGSARAWSKSLGAHCIVEPVFTLYCRTRRVSSIGNGFAFENPTFRRMVALVSRLIILAQALAGLGLCWVALRFWRIGSPLLAAAFGVAAVLLFRLLLAANNFWLAWRYRSETPEHRRLSLLGATKLFLGEFYASLKTANWTMAFRQFERGHVASPIGLPVLLVHGYGCNSGYWHAMSSALRKARILHHAVSLEPMFVGIEEFVPALARAIEQLCAETRQRKIVIVAHSMGGLVTRAYIRKCGSSRLAKVITLGTPHEGTGLAAFGVGLNSRQMRRDGGPRNGRPSPWLTALAEHESASDRALFVSMYSHHDNIIAPQTSSALAGAKNVEFHGIGHVALALHPLVQRAVINEVLATQLPAEPAA